MNNIEIIYFISTIIFSIIITPVIKGLVEKFIKEDKILEKVEEDIQNEIKKGNITKKQGEIKFKEEVRKNKIKFKPKFSFKILIITLILNIVLVGIKIFFKQLNILEFIVYEFLLTILLIDAYADIKGYIIPNETNFLGFIVGTIYVFYNFVTNTEVGIDLLLGAIFGFTIFLIISFIALLIFKKEGMGGGDIKLMGVIGLFMGLKNNIQIFIFSFFIAAIIGGFLIIIKRKSASDYIPFGPFIVMATYITMIVPAQATINYILDLIPIYHI